MSTNDMQYLVIANRNKFNSLIKQMEKIATVILGTGQFAFLTYLMLIDSKIVPNAFITTDKGADKYICEIFRHGIDCHNIVYLDNFYNHNKKQYFDFFKQPSN